LIKMEVNSKRILSLCILHLGLAVLIHGKEQCGKPISMKSGIYGGNETCLGCIPWQVSLQHSGRHICGGTIVSSRFVVTAAHCAEAFVLQKVLAGMVDYEDDAATEHRIEKIYVHPMYGSWTHDYDYAIVELKDPIKLYGGSKSRAACLPWDNPVFDDSTIFKISGWGDGSEEPNLLMDISVPWHSTKECQSKFPKQITDRMICAGHLRREVDRVCHGDSGGGLIWRDPQDGLSKLIGVTSWGQPSCNKGYPAIYARITAVLQWIKGITNLD